MGTGYIADGYSRPGFIRKPEGNDTNESFWEDLEFVYRPGARLEIVKHDAEVKSAIKDEFSPRPDDAVKAEKLACKFVADHLVSWSLKDDGGNDVPCTADSCGRLNAGLFHRLYSIVRGTQLNDQRAGEESPAKSDEEQQKN